MIAVLASWSLSLMLSLDYSPTRILGIGLAIAIVGTIGDLSESWVKRLSGVKDSGSIIPGHGGILDRLDALAPNFMLIYFVERWLG
jgi:phosphatidate cytidylyltransferase